MHITTLTRDEILDIWRTYRDAAKRTAETVARLTAPDIQARVDPDCALLEKMITALATQTLISDKLDWELGLRADQPPEV